MSTTFLSRSRNKDVLFSLAVAWMYDEELGRLRLQKFIYLADILSQTWRKLGNPATFRPYKNGPYDAGIQNAVDSLVFRGFAAASNLSFGRPGFVECTYRPTETGLHVVDALCAAHYMADDFTLYQEIAQEVDRRGWGKIKSLVYAEPTYDSLRMESKGGRIRADIPSKNITFLIIKDLENVFYKSGVQRLTRKNVVQLFFALLDEGRHLQTE